MGTILSSEGGARWYNPDGSPQHDADLRVARKAKLMPSVTTIDKGVHPNAFLEQWKLEQLGRAAFESQPQPHEGVKDYVRRVHELSLRKSKTAIDFGHALHDAVEVYPQLPLDQKIMPWFNAFGDWYQKYGLFKISAEAVLVDSDIGVAGRTDYIGNKGDTEIVADWKGLALDTPIPTPSGWTTMADLAVGDKVLSSDGRPTFVVGKSQIHNRPCYRLEFDDGSSIVCDNVHRWSITATQRGASIHLAVPTEEIIDIKNSGHIVTIENTSPILPELQDEEMLVDPYLLGVWLGDGSSDEPKVTLPGAKGPIIDYIRNTLGFQCREYTPGSFYIKGLVGKLGRLGVLRNKHIPASYMRSSIGNRRKLLAGLLDTDGHWHIKRKQVTICSTDKALADQIYELVVSLGWKASRYDGENNGFGVTAKYRRISFTPFGHNPFMFNAKNTPGAQQHVNGTSRCRRRQITGIMQVESVPTQCISVNAANRIYLAGRQMVPTHNTQDVKVDDKGRKRPAFYDSWGRQLAFYCVARAKQRGMFPSLPRAISVVIDSNEPTEPFVKEWTKEEIESHYRTFLAGVWIWCNNRNYWPVGQWSLCPTVPYL